MTKEQLRHIRTELGLSQSGLAKKLGVTWQQVSNWERGQRTITRQTILAIECILRRGKKTELVRYLRASEATSELQS